MGKLAITGGKPIRRKPFTAWPAFGQQEARGLQKVLASRNWGGFPFPNKYADAFAQKFARYHGAKYGVAVSNGTIAIEIALKAAGIKPGDEVIVPAYTWEGTVGPILLLNAVPVFVDIDPDTYCLDARLIEAALTPKTRAIMPVHLAMRFADMDEICLIAKAHKLVVIEDCAHAHGGQYKGRGAGSMGGLGTFSFQESKLLTAGEGGIVITNDDMFNQKLHSLVNCGRKEPGYDEFEGFLLGWNYRLGEFQAAVLIAQLEKLDERTKQRAANAAYFGEQLRKIKGLSVIELDKRTTTPGHYQYIFKYDPAGFKGLHRDKFLEALMMEGFMFDGDFYVPLPGRDIFPVTADYYPAIRERYGEAITAKHADDLPVSKKAAFEESVWVHYPYLMGGKELIDEAIEAIKKIQDNVDELL